MAHRQKMALYARLEGEPGKTKRLVVLYSDRGRTREIKRYEPTDKSRPVHGDKTTVINAMRYTLVWL
jgi:hypothetical protein